MTSIICVHLSKRSERTSTLHFTMKQPIIMGRENKEPMYLRWHSDLFRKVSGESVRSFARHLEKVNYHFDTGILATPLLLQVLTENGRADLAYKLMNQRDFPSYGYLADKKNNTLWETWNGDGNDEGCGHCHPMFGSVVAWFYHSLAGIKPDQSDPGMKHFYIEPMIVPDLEILQSYV